jgi:uncharacterized membrane protein
MPKKSSNSSAVVDQSVAPVAVEKVVVEKKVKASKSNKVEAPVVEVPPPVVGSDNIVMSVDAPVDGEPVLGEMSTEFVAKLQTLSGMIAALKVEYRALEKKWLREVKAAQKISTKRKRKAGNRAPSGFVKPTKISDELATFLGKDKGSEMARTEVTREINKYIRSNSLQDKENGRKINADSKLASLLKLKKTDELTYFNLQRHMSPHFAKANKDVVVATA